MSSTYGQMLRLSIFGQSHGPAIGMTLDGVPAGLSVDLEQLQLFLDRRAPGQGDYATPRKELDRPEFLSGLLNGHTCGAPLAAVIRNTNTRSGDYGKLQDCPRPGHADFSAQMKYGGAQDVAGGGHFSGRLTAPLCIAGGLCKQFLAQQGIQIGAHLSAVGQVRDIPFDPLAPQLSRVGSFPTISPEAGTQMVAAIAAARAERDSLGGVIECAAVGLPAGLGEPMFGGMENRIAAILFGIPAVKAVEFGEGFHAAELRGSENNDAFSMNGDQVCTVTNHAGGILGGITTGMPLLLRVAIKPTPSIGKRQQTISLSQGIEVPLEIKGRHDPCIAPRAVPVVEAAVAIAVYDAFLERNARI